MSESEPELRTLRVRAEGMALFGRWAQELRDAEAAGEAVPSPEEASAEEIAAWLDERGLIVAPVDRLQAATLIELVVAGGVAQVPLTSEEAAEWERRRAEREAGEG